MTQQFFKKSAKWHIVLLCRELDNRYVGSLEALPVDNGGSGLIILFLADPHVLEGGQANALEPVVVTVKLEVGEGQRVWPPTDVYDIRRRCHGLHIATWCHGVIHRQVQHTARRTLVNVALTGRPRTRRRRHTGRRDRFVRLLAEAHCGRR